MPYSPLIFFINVTINLRAIFGIIMKFMYIFSLSNEMLSKVSWKKRDGCKVTLTRAGKLSWTRYNITNTVLNLTFFNLFWSVKRVWLDMCVFAQILNSFRVTKSEALGVDDRCLSNANWIVGWQVSCMYRKSKKCSHLNADLRGGLFVWFVCNDSTWWMFPKS